MSRCTTVLLIAALMLAGCSRQASQTQQLSGTSTSPASHAPTDYVVGEPIHHANLSIFPVSSPNARSEDRFTTLDEGLREGTVKVFEIGSDGDSEAEAPSDPFGGAPAEDTPPDDPFGDPLEEYATPADDLFGDAPFGDCYDPDIDGNEGPLFDDTSELLEETLVQGVQADHFHGMASTQAEVNRVMVINRSRKPLYLMPGEIIMGGDQDRCVAQEFVIQPGDTPVAVDVFCVEHGRWGGRANAVTEQFAMSAMSVAEESVSFDMEVTADDLATEANKGKFVASIGALNAKARFAVQASKDQSKVWESVADVNAANGIALESGAFTGNYTDEASLERLAPYHEALLDEVTKVENVIGVIVAINGKVQTMDLFESTPLFRKLWPKLLKSYALDAANSDSKTDAQCTRADATAFLSESMNGEVEDSDVLRGIATTRRATDQIVSFAAEAAESSENAAAADPFGGGFGGVHTSAFSK